MEKKSGVSETAASLPSGGGALKSIGDTFQPNLGMGGGSYKIPIDLPQGPGGFSPKLELLYNTGSGSGPFGLGWMLAVPFIGQRPKPLFAPPGEPEYTVSGVETLVAGPDGAFVPFIQAELQSFEQEGDHWVSKAPNLVDMRFGSSEESRVTGLSGGSAFVSRWLLDRVTFSGGRHVDFEYEADGPQRYLRRVRWSVFRVELVYEARPDPFSSFEAGFEVRTRRRCSALELHHDRLAPDTLCRLYRFEYEQARHTALSLLHRVQVSGFRQIDGATHEATLPALTFGYTGFDPTAQSIRRFESTAVPPPLFSDDATLFDYRGSALPGILRLDGREATYWENRGRLTWGPPERLPGLPQGVHLSDDGVRFADLTGNGAVDLLTASDQGRGFYPNDPERGFLPKRAMRLAPSFEFGEEGSFVLDLDGDRVADYVTFRNGTALAFFNEGDGESWRGPIVLPPQDLPNLVPLGARLRLADMNGDGLSDLVLLRSRQVTYWPSLGKGRFGPARTLDRTPEFDVPDPDSDVLLADLDGDGTSDLILIGNGEVRIHLNSAGEAFAEAIVLSRTPRLNVQQLLMADLTGSGTAGFFWSTATGAQPHEYWYLDPLNGVKPYLLRTIDNGMGQVTTIDYSTSAFERAADLAEGRRWTGHLPFVVQVVKQLTVRDLVTGLGSATEYRYHDGHYDGRAREFVGFASVDSLQPPTAQMEAVHRRLHFHSRGVSADDPAFIAGKGQPHRTELLHPVTGELRQVDEAEWEALPVATVSTDRPAWLAVEASRSSRRFQDGEVYEREDVGFTRNLTGSVVREHRRGEWRDSAGERHLDELVIEHEYAVHPLRGLTSLPCQLAKSDGAGRVLKHFRFFYDGAAFEGLPFGVVDLGFRTRQTEVALTSREVDEAYDGVAPPSLASLYRTETLGALGPAFVKDMRRYRVDAFGNQLETIDALGHRVAIAYDADHLLPVSIAEDGLPARPFEHDPLCQQATRVADLNGNVVEHRYDAFGNVLAVFRRGAAPDRPSESYEYHHESVPTFSIQRVRVGADDAEPGWVKYEYRDGSSRPCLVKTRTEDDRWAISKQNLYHPNGMVMIERAARFADTPDFEAADAEAVERRSFYDFALRLVRERGYSGRDSLYVHDRNTVRFYGPERAEAFAADPGLPPTRVSRKSAWGRVVSIQEFDQGGTHEQRRDYDAVDRLVRVTGPLGPELQSTYDFWGNRIRVDSAECGTTRYVYDAGNNEITRTDADGRLLFFPRDERGRVLELRVGGPQGPVEETYHYDGGPGSNLRGRLSRVEGAFGTVAYSYTDQGDPASISRTFAGRPETFETRFTYNAQKKVTSVVYPDGTEVEYRYHPNGLLRSIPGYIDAVAYSAAGGRARVQFANGVLTTRAYSPGDDLLLELRTERAGVAYQDLVYGLDAVGQVMTIADHSNVAGKVRNNQTFAYDTRNRLVEATGRGAEGEYRFVYRYDEAGNLVFSGESFAEEMDYGRQVGDAAHPNRLVKRRAQAGPEYEYDASGNLTRDPELGRLVYDARHRLVRVEKTDGAVVEYSYDHENRRTGSRVTRNGETTWRLEVEGVYLVDADGATKVVFDDERRLAIVPPAGDRLLHHLDRLGNVNVVTNLETGAFVGHDEYTPYGRLSVSMAIEPHFHYQGAAFSDSLDTVLLGARHYRPRLGRFLTPDRYLALHQEKITAFHAAANLYLYALANPANFTDPTGQIAFLAVLLIAAIVGAVLGAIGAAVNGVKTWDEFLLWIIGGAIGAVIGTLFWAVIGIAFGLSCVVAAIVGLVIWGTASFLATILTPALDATDSEVAWAFSFALKLIQSPIMTILGLIVAAFAAAGGSRVDFRRGMLFVELGSGMGALTLGAIAWTRGGEFDASGNVSDSLAQHESFHSRTVGSIGEWGFYLTYITIGAIWGAAQGGDWNDLNDTTGCGQPFEKTAHTFTGDPAVAVAADDC